MDFQPKYVYCNRCYTGYGTDMVGPLCPRCGIPFSSVVGTVKGNVSFSTPASTVPPSQLPEGIVLYIPGELREAFITFLEVGLASATAYMEDLEDDELRLIELLQDFIEHQGQTEPTTEETGKIPLEDDKQFKTALQHFSDRLKQEAPTPEEVLNRNRTLLRGDSADIEGL